MAAETGQAPINPEHPALVDLLGDAGGICRSAAAEAACGNCSNEVLQHCRTRLLEAVERLMELMLDHFNREDALMNTLPQTGLARVHCIRHREDHVAISARYNRIIGELESGDAAKGSRTLEAVVGAWLHEHARHFDVELAAMLEGA